MLLHPASFTENTQSMESVLPAQDNDPRERRETVL